MNTTARLCLGTALATLTWFLPGLTRAECEQEARTKCTTSSQAMEYCVRDHLAEIEHYRTLQSYREYVHKPDATAQEYRDALDQHMVYDQASLEHTPYDVDRPYYRCTTTLYKKWLAQLAVGDIRPGASDAGKRGAVGSAKKTQPNASNADTKPKPLKQRKTVPPRTACIKPERTGKYTITFKNVCTVPVAFSYCYTKTDSASQVDDLGSVNCARLNDTQHFSAAGVAGDFLGPWGFSQETAPEDAGHILFIGCQSGAQNVTHAENLKYVGGKLSGVCREPISDADAGPANSGVR